MSDIEVTFSKPEAAAAASVGDYVALLKPRVMSLALFTAAVGMAVAPQPLHPVLALAALIFIAMGSFWLSCRY